MDVLTNILFSTSVAGSIGCVAYVVAQRLVHGDDKRIANRLNDRFGRPQSQSAVTADGAAAGKRVSPFKRLGLAASGLFSSNAKKTSALRAKLASAGIYDPAVIRSLVGFRFLMLVGGVGFGYLLGMALAQELLGLALGGLVGYMAPSAWVRAKVSANQKALNIGLPDALDLMVICVESGLTIDATLLRVGEELQLAHPAVSREFGICHTETRLGVSRQDAFKNLATRTANTNLQALTAMLIQADRFGTGIGQALRVQAESMRDRRQTMAEEMAAKASVKMSFPLVLFIFPATFMVMMGPMIVQFMENSDVLN